MIDFNNYIKRGLIRKDDALKKIADFYLRKARNNLVGMRVDYDVSVREEIQEKLNIEGFAEYDWVVIKAYYAMYMGALACLAKIGLKVENHNAVVVCLEHYFVKKGMLEKEYLHVLKDISLELDYVDDLRDVKESRIVAQYNVSEEFEKRRAKEVMDVAYKFVDRMAELFRDIQKEVEEDEKVE